MIYAARFDTMNALLGYLTENCCQGRSDLCVTPDQCVPMECKAAEFSESLRPEEVS